MKLTTAVNFSNVLLVAFKQIDPKSGKMTKDLNVIFALLGSTHDKVLRKMLIKLTPEISF